MNNKQIHILSQASKREKDGKVLRRIQMVLYIFKGETIREVEERMRCPHSLVIYWKKRYLSEGLDGFKTRPKSGKPRKISRRQESNLKNIFSRKNLDEPWTTKRISNLIAEKTNVNYSQRQVRRILNRWNFGLTSGRPIYWHRASEEEIKKFGKKNLVLQK